MWLCFEIPINIRKYRKNNYKNYVYFLTSEPYKKQSQFFYGEFIFLIVLILTSFISEMYVGLKVKKLPFCQLKSVTIGHLGMSLTALTFIEIDSNSICSIRPPLLCFIFQLLYVVKYRDFLIVKIRKLVSPNNITPSDDINLNEFGIFVGEPKSVGTSSDSQLRNSELKSKTNQSNCVTNITSSDSIPIEVEDISDIIEHHEETTKSMVDYESKDNLENNFAEKKQNISDNITKNSESNVKGQKYGGVYTG